MSSFFKRLVDPDFNFMEDNTRLHDEYLENEDVAHMHSPVRSSYPNTIRNDWGTLRRETATGRTILAQRTAQGLKITLLNGWDHRNV